MKNKDINKSVIEPNKLIKDVHMPLILSISAERISNKKFMNFNELDINLCYSESRIGLCHLYLFIYLFIYLFKHG